MFNALMHDVGTIVVLKHNSAFATAYFIYASAHNFRLL